MKFLLGFITGITTFYLFLQYLNKIPKMFWNSFGTLGEWVGAILTTTALYFALKKDKPRLRFKSVLNNRRDIGRMLYINVLSISYVPLTIERFCIIDPNFTKTFVCYEDKNIIIPPMRQVTLTKLIYDNVINKGFKDTNDILGFCYVIDTFGNKHFIKNDFKSKIKRFLSYIFGKKII